jgi:hypothetical protein
MYKAKFLKWPFEQLEEMLLIMIAQDEIETKTFEIAYDAYCNHQDATPEDVLAMDDIINGIDAE